MVKKTKKELAAKKPAQKPAPPEDKPAPEETARKEEGPEDPFSTTDFRMKERLIKAGFTVASMAPVVTKDGTRKQYIFVEPASKIREFLKK